MRLQIHTFVRMLSLLGALLVLSGLPVGAAAQSDVGPSIDVSAVGEEHVAPDLALLDLTVEREAESARAAVSQANDAMAAVIARLRELGVAERDLQTSRFAVEPRVEYPEESGKPRSPRTIGYRARNGLVVRVRDLSKVGLLLDEAITLGVNRGGNVRFTNDDPSAALRRARASAMAVALDKARTMAEALNLTLGRVLSINEIDDPGMPMPMAAARSFEAADSGSVPIASGENTYRVRVQVRWAIEQ
ncbi:MAG: SIMPL domain-containing protein [Burkholderiaceae bacterium]